MNDNARALIAALRSGDFEQGTGYLTRTKNDGVEYDCCLGVACKLALKAGVLTSEEVVREDWSVGTTYAGEAGVLPDKVRAWLGFRDRSGQFEGNNYSHYSLTAMNDAARTFEEIADLIESEPKGLFLPEQE